MIHGAKCSQESRSCEWNNSTHTDSLLKLSTIQGWVYGGCGRAGTEDRDGLYLPGLFRVEAHVVGGLSRKVLEFRLCGSELAHEKELARYSISAGSS